MKRALVTGITSYPGLSLAKRLLELNVEVHAVIREQTNLGRLEQLTGPIDINRHDGSVENLISTVGRVNPDVIFHLAGHYMASHGEGDIEGAIAIYGPIPEPASLTLLAMASLALLRRYRKGNN